MSRHQKHSVRNKNRKLRLQHDVPITIQRAFDLISDPEDGRLRVVPEREFDFKVPFSLGEGKHSYENAPNPVNQLGGLVAGHVPVSTSNDFASFLAAFNKRSNFEQNKEDDDIDDSVFHESMRLINSLPDLFEKWDDNDIDRERWLNKFNSSKRQRMENAFNEVPFADYKYVGTKDLSVKMEVLLKRYDETWAPRVIYAGNDVFNTITGPAAMVTMERFVHLCELGPIGGVHFMPAYKKNDTQLLEFLVDPRYNDTVEGDFSRNDREQRSRVAILYDCWLQKLGLPEWFRTLNLTIEKYKVQNRNFGFVAFLKYQLPTGTTNTTARNSMYNATMFAVTCLRQKRTGKALILGDDLLARLNKRLDLDAWVVTVAKFKMVLKAKAPDLDGDATFLSRRIILTNDLPCMIPLIGKAIARFNARGTTNPSVNDDDYMAGKALSYAYEFRHVPWMSKRFLKRYHSYVVSNEFVEELSWFTRTSGLSSYEQIMDAINNETVKIDDDTFEFWLLNKYDSDLYELELIMDATVNNPKVEVVDLPWFEKFVVDI